MTTRVARKTKAASVAAGLEDKAEEAARLLSAMANPKRLMVLCNLIDAERAVGDLAEQVGLRQAALSQHLAMMRALDLVATRRDGQTIYYRLASHEVREVLQTLYRLYCA
ncbi:metalloregulator ArsR/SmtB family transcription factor [Bradyrhizobium sp. STM 3809]|uniref:ArsR/SmtB family transcription factor n=1 Tax=Bradyrhizobium sp. STM 3809 TaxID=551936 RepID=UPI00024091E7|nr:metalloregulator ArsR/SmtB family transcription factor [Bradyrhizobium sp. STM 3809]CCE00332.1 putative transcriptional regulatory protein, Ars family [Bradyrhizobium sp. STM 3809]